jgi:hypothetical protein
MNAAQWLRMLAVLGSLTCDTALAQAQDATVVASETSAQASVTFDTNFGDLGTWLRVTPTGGVTVNNRWSFEVGLPIYHLGESATAPGTSLTGIGDMYASVSFDMSGDTITAHATGTAGVPTGDADNALGAGTATWDLSGSLERPFGTVTPSLNAGVGNNSLVAASSPTRQLNQSAGYLFHVEGWAEVQVLKPLAVSAGVYAVRQTASNTAATLDEEEFDDSSDDEGYQLVATATLTRSMDLSLWFTRSTAYTSSTWSVSLGLDVASLLRKSGAPPRDRRRLRR